MKTILTMIMIALVSSGCTTRLKWGDLALEIPVWPDRSFDRCEAEVVDPNGLKIKFVLINYDNAGIVPVVEAAVRAAVEGAVR